MPDADSVSEVAVQAMAGALCVLGLPEPSCCDRPVTRRRHPECALAALVASREVRAGLVRVVAGVRSRRTQTLADVMLRDEDAVDAVLAALTPEGDDACYCGPNGGPHRHVVSAHSDGSDDA